MNHPVPVMASLLPLFSQYLNGTTMDFEPESGDPSRSLEGRYSNYFKIGHNAFEFVIDFGQHYNNSENKGQFHTRIVTNPTYAKALCRLFQDAIAQYELTYGTVPNESQE